MSRAVRRNYRKGLVVLHDGRRTVKVPLRTESRGEPAHLQGVYKTRDGRLMTVRSTWPEIEELMRGGRGPKLWGLLMLSELNIEGGRAVETLMRGKQFGVPSVFEISHKASRMALPDYLEDRHIEKELASKGERHQRLRKGGTNRITVSREMRDTFRSLGYEEVPHQDESGGIVYLDMIKTRRSKPRHTHDLLRHHNIRAVNPETGRVKTFTLPIKG